MYVIQSLSRQAVVELHLLSFQSNVPGQGLLNSIAQFITGPFGKAITLIAIVLCGVSYMYGKQSDNSSIGRLAIGAALIVGAANNFVECGRLRALPQTQSKKSKASSHVS